MLWPILALYHPFRVALRMYIFSSLATKLTLRNVAVWPIHPFRKLAEGTNGGVIRCVFCPALGNSHYGEGDEGAHRTAIVVAENSRHRIVEMAEKVRVRSVNAPGPRLPSSPNFAHPPPCICRSTKMLVLCPFGVAALGPLLKILISN
jgi:hypothetical protein